MESIKPKANTSKYSKRKPGKNLGYAKLHIAIGEHEVVTQLTVWNNDYKVAKFAPELFKALLEYQKSDSFEDYITTDIAEVNFNLNENLESKIAVYANCVLISPANREINISFPISFDRQWKRELTQLLDENPESEFIPTAEDCYIEWIAIDPEKKKESNEPHGWDFLGNK